MEVFPRAFPVHHGQRSAFAVRLHPARGGTGSDRRVGQTTSGTYTCVHLGWSAWWPRRRRRYDWHQSMSFPRRVEPELLDQLPADDPRAIRARRDVGRANTLMMNAGIIASALMRH